VSLVLPPRSERGRFAGAFYTADAYAGGDSEEVVGEALAGGKRDAVILATKFYFPMSDDPNRRGTSRRWIMQAVDDSLRRLRTDWIDLYQVHRYDPMCDLDETLAALSDLVHAGKVRYIGSSTFPAHVIVEAQWVAERRHRERYVCEQPPYSILARGIERDVLPVCEHFGLGVITWSPLAGGWLAGGYRKGQPPPSSSRAERLAELYDQSLPENQRKLEAADALATIAEEAGLTLVDMALAFVLEHPAVTSAILGPRTSEQLESQLGVCEVILDRELLDRIDELVPPGVTLSEADAGYTPPAIAETSRRRRT
jgi:aryl-alcohol dehydrogenase-like predicted oxidoreductase